MGKRREIVVWRRSEEYAVVTEGVNPHGVGQVGCTDPTARKRGVGSRIAPIDARARSGLTTFGLLFFEPVPEVRSFSSS